MTNLTSIYHISHIGNLTSTWGGIYHQPVIYMGWCLSSTCHLYDAALFTNLTSISEVVIQLTKIIIKDIHRGEKMNESASVMHSTQGVDPEHPKNLHVSDANALAMNTHHVTLISQMGFVWLKDKDTLLVSILNSFYLLVISGESILVLAKLTLGAIFSLSWV